MRPIGVGLIGYGLGGRAFHAPYVRAARGLKLRAIVSRDPSRVHADLPDVEVVLTVEDLLDYPGIDLVIVSSPDALHADHAIAALEAGKHVVIDKPFATDLAAALRVSACADAREKLITVFHNRRWDADFRTLQHLIAEDALGHIVQFESHFDRWRPNPAETWKEARHGGSWLDLGPHLVDQAIVLFGMPHGVLADLATLRKGAPAPDYFHVTLRYPDRRVILHSSKLVAENGLRFAVHGTRGSWVKHGIDPQEAATVEGLVPEGDDWGHDPTPGQFTSADDPTCSMPVANVNGDYRMFWTALEAAVRNVGPNPVPASQALDVMRVLHAGLTSAAEHREVSPHDDSMLTHAGIRSHG